MTEILAEAKELHVVKVEIPLEASFSENFASTSLDFLIEKSSVESALCDESEHSSLLQTPQVQPKSLTEVEFNFANLLHQKYFHYCSSNG